MGVALSILGNNTASLVGVAISASLLPPAVNAGICWAHAILIRTGSVDNPSHADFAKIGAISFALTVVNIFCIWIFGMLMFAIKVRVLVLRSKGFLIMSVLLTEFLIRTPAWVL